MKALLDRVREHKTGQRVGIWSLCSAHPVVIEAALREAKGSGGQVLIEATSNQVNQFGGYTGMKPADFCAYVGAIATKVGLAADQILLGGDHLGPNSWQDRDCAQAMEHASKLIADYVAAGFRKIHLDCSMSCADDPRPLSDSQVSERAATLCEVAERSWREAAGEPPVYIIGTEVPVPGGAAEELETLAVTSPAAAAVTLEAGDVTAVELAFTKQDERGGGLKAEFGGDLALRDAVPFHQQAQNLNRARFGKGVAQGFVLLDEEGEEIDGLLLGRGGL